MSTSKAFPRIRAVLLFILLPLIGDLLFIDTIIKDTYVRRRIRVIFSLCLLAVIAIGFSTLELQFVLGAQEAVFPIEVMYTVTSLSALIAFILFCIEGWEGKVSLDEKVLVIEDKVSLVSRDYHDVFVTLTITLNVIQLRRCRSNQCDNSRLASFALAVLGEYLRKRTLYSLRKNRP
jgi:hypothetical protein